ncbi:hypothetical protein ABW20_dc0109086 [Dactylellina cionopaga]|nr:hypothetical protein ABW20_dc0109086 [Dactylellina cionopaga]
MRHSCMYSGGCLANFPSSAKTLLGCWRNHIGSRWWCGIYYAGRPPIATKFNLDEFDLNIQQCYLPVGPRFYDLTPPVYIANSYLYRPDKFKHVSDANHIDTTIIYNFLLTSHHFEST